MDALGLADTIAALRSKGYTEDFNLPSDLLNQDPGILRIEDDEFVVDQVFRFDVMSDPGDQSILYAIHSEKTGKKGLLVNGYGVYSETLANRKAETLNRWETDGGKSDDIYG